MNRTLDHISFDNLLTWLLASKAAHYAMISLYHTPDAPLVTTFGLYPIGRINIIYSLDKLLI